MIGMSVGSIGVFGLLHSLAKLAFVTFFYITFGCLLVRGWGCGQSYKPRLSRVVARSVNLFVQSKLYTELSARLCRISHSCLPFSYIPRYVLYRDEVEDPSNTRAP